MARQGEYQYTDIVVGCHAFYGTAVEYASGYAVQGGPLFVAFGIVTGKMHNAKVRRQAEQMAALQWRWEGEIRVVLTDQRLFVFFGTGAEVFEMERLLSITPSPDGRAVHFSFAGKPPLLFSGAWAPWLCVVASGLAHRSTWPPGHTLPGFATPELSAPETPAMAPAALPRRPERAQLPSPHGETNLAERLAEQVDPLPADQAAAVLAEQGVQVVERVLDLLGSRRAGEIRAALRRLKE
ncbi:MULTISPECIES: hypothetical protein [unclassified Streptomyces]|uniref:hypothetical protein n=1 Tax=unclassified Streptomyces TaxID=2593676 RepID=UPI000AB6070A|nr:MULTISPECIES: hypothetical protein [unclassified Streptomyces]